MGISLTYSFSPLRDPGQLIRLWDSPRKFHLNPDRTAFIVPIPEKSNRIWEKFKQFFFVSSESKLREQRLSFLRKLITVLRWNSQVDDKKECNHSLEHLKIIVDQIYKSVPLTNIKNPKEKQIWKHKLSLLRWELLSAPLRSSKTFSPFISPENEETLRKKNIEFLKDKLVVWKSRSDLFQAAGAISLCPREERQIEKLARYPALVDEMRNHHEYMHFVFEKTIIHNFPVSLVACYPLIADKIFSSRMQGAIGTGGKKAIRVNKTPGQKGVEIYVAGKWVKFHRIQRIISEKWGDLGTISDLCRDFRHRHNKGSVTRFYLPKEGFTNWDPYRLAWVDPSGKRHPVTLQGDNWMEALPEYQNLSSEEMVQQYGVSPEKGKDYVMECAAGKTAQLDPGDWHGYLEYAKAYVDETSGKVRYRIYPFGKYAKNWPNQRKAREMVSFIGNTVEAIVSYPDPNNQYRGWRIVCTNAHAISRQAAHIFEGKLFKIIEQARAGHLNFQFAGENCIHLPGQLLQETKAELLKSIPKEEIENHVQGDILDTRIRLVEAKPTNPLLKKIVRICRLSNHPKIQLLFVRLFVLLFRMYRKRTIEWVDSKGNKYQKDISVLTQNSGIWTKGKIFMPSTLLVKSKEQDPAFKNVHLQFGFIAPKSHLSTTASAA